MTRVHGKKHRDARDLNPKTIDRDGRGGRDLNPKTIDRDERGGVSVTERVTSDVIYDVREQWATSTYAKNFEISSSFITIGVCTRTLHATRHDMIRQQSLGERSAFKFFSSMNTSEVPNLQSLLYVHSSKRKKKKRTLECESSYLIPFIVFIQ